MKVQTARMNNDFPWGWIIGIFLAIAVAIAITSNSRIYCAWGNCSNTPTVLMESPSGKAIAYYCDEHSAEMAERGWKVAGKP